MAKAIMISGNGNDGKLNKILDGSYEGELVLDIESARYKAFSGLQFVTKITLTKLKKLSALSFDSVGKSLLEIELPEAVGNTYTYTFSNNYRLRKVSIPKISTINQFAFSNCKSLKNIDCNKVVRIEGNSFLNCNSLEKINFPVVGSIVHSSVFKNCISLTQVVLGTNDTTGICNIEEPTNIFENTPIANSEGFIYVADSLLEQYQTIYANIATYFKGMSELEGGN